MDIFTTRFARQKMSRPADSFLPSSAMDVTVISTLQPLALSGAASAQGHALQVGEQRKMAAHNEACRAVGVTLIPLWLSH